MSFRSLAASLLCLVLTLSACGGGGNGDGDQNGDPLALIEGSWKGTCMLGGDVIDITISPTGEITQLDLDGVPENLTGFFTHLTERLYAVTITPQVGPTSDWRLLIDPTATYAALTEVDGPLQMVALQKDAAAVPPRTLAEYAPGAYAGQGASVDAAGTLLQLAACSVDIDAGAAFDGDFGALSFFTPTGSPLDLRVANGTVLQGEYDDNDAGSAGDTFLLVTCPDGGAVAVLAFDTTAGVILFFGLLPID